MNAPIKPRYTYVDQQLYILQNELGRELPFRLFFQTNVGYWHAIGELSDEDNERIAAYIRREFDWLKSFYEGSKEVTDILDQSVILIQNCLWAAMNNTFPEQELDVYINRTVDNIMHVYNRVVHPRLRGAMIAANHNCEVIQRVWRRCNTNPTHPICRRRLDREFEEDVKALRA
jgi:hypothetical protein